MLLLNSSRLYIFTSLILLLFIFVFIVTRANTTASFSHRHGKAQTARLPNIIALTTSSSPSYTSLLLSNLPAHIHPVPPPNASVIDERVYPQGYHRHLSENDRAAWRAHMDAMQYIIEKNLHVGLIVSGNVPLGKGLLQRVQAGDWDVMFLNNTADGFAYAVTQSGARMIMYEHGIRNFDREFGQALGEWCRGETRNMGERPRCVDGGMEMEK